MVANILRTQRSERFNNGKQCNMKTTELRFKPRFVVPQSPCAQPLQQVLPQTPCLLRMLSHCTRFSRMVIIQENLS